MKVPAPPAHRSASGISTHVTPGMRLIRSRGGLLTPAARKWHDEWEGTVFGHGLAGPAFNPAPARHLEICLAVAPTPPALLRSSPWRPVGYCFELNAHDA